MKLHELLLFKKDFGLTRVAFLTAFLAIVVLQVGAQSVPPGMNYQGRLTDSAGQFVAPGVYTIAFRIWDKQSGGAGEKLIWGREYQATVIGGGTFNVILGGAGGQDLSGAQTMDLTAAFAGSERFLGITLTRDATGQAVSNPREIFPRSQILSAPYALRAERAASASSLAQDLYDALCPPGTVIAWMGINNVPPSGWEFCRGQVANRTDPRYARLFSVIGTSNGAGTSDTTFHLPDLRGVFLRGVNGDRSDAFADLDSNSRTNRVVSGNTGNRVGSVQMDELKSHTHTVPHGGARAHFMSFGGSSERFDQAQTTSPTGGNESRPKNVYVQYLIKL